MFICAGCLLCCLFLQVDCHVHFFKFFIIFFIFALLIMLFIFAIFYYVVYVCVFIMLFIFAFLLFIFVSVTSRVIVNAKQMYGLMVGVYQCI